MLFFMQSPSFQVLQLFPTIVVHGVSPQKGRRTAEDICMFVDFFKPIIKFILFLFLQIFFFDLIGKIAVIIFLNIFCSIISRQNKSRSFEIVEFEVFLLENVSVLDLFFIESIDVVYIEISFLLL